MRAYELNESTPVIDIIRENCSTILGSETRLYRGVDKKPDQFIGTIREDRKPLASSFGEAKIFDLTMEKLNLPFRKSNTLSVSVTRDQAQTYTEFQNVYRVFPFDGATYLYCTEYDDIMYFSKNVLDKFRHYAVSNDLISGNISLRRELRTKLFQNSEYDEMFMDWFKDKDYSNSFKTGSLDDIKGAWGEILIYGAKYGALMDWPPGEIDEII